MAGVPVAGEAVTLAACYSQGLVEIVDPPRGVLLVDDRILVVF